MKRVKIILIFVILIISCLHSYSQNNNSGDNENSINSIKVVVNQEEDNDISYIEECEIINSVLPRIYNVAYCHRISKLSKTIKQELKDYRILSEKERDTIPKVIWAVDSLISFDIKKYKNYILKSLDTISGDFAYIKKLNTTLNAKKLNINLLKQNGVEFIKASKSREIEHSSVYGKRNGTLYIGYMCFSRVVFSEKHNIGLFSYTYLGGSNCGYNSYVIFSKFKSEWVFKKNIHTGFY